MTQNDIVLGYMKKHGFITILESIYDLKITRLGARILELKKEGHLIMSEPLRVTKADGTKTTVKKYWLYRNEEKTGQGVLL